MRGRRIFFSRRIITKAKDVLLKKPSEIARPMGKIGYLGSGRALTI